MKCCVENCGKKYNKENKKGFFAFPKDKKVLKQWLTFCGISKVTKGMKVCDAHFKDEDIDGKTQRFFGISRNLTLKPGAIPSILVGQKEEIGSQREQRLMERNRRQFVSSILGEATQYAKNEAQKELTPQVDQIDFTGHELCVQMEQTVSTIDAELPNWHESIQTEQIRTDINTVCQSTDNSQLQIDELKNELKLLKQENKNLTKNFCRKEMALEHVIKKQEYEIDQLKMALLKAESLCKNMENHLSEIFTEGQIAKLKKGNRRQNWTADDIARSITLYSASPKMYRLLRRKNFPLPAVRTLQSWAQKIEISPGILQPVVEILKETAQMTDIQKLSVLSFDEMKIRKSYCYDKTTDSTLLPANYVQVGMLRGLVTDWKQPIFYNYDCSMTEDVIRNILSTTEKMGFSVVALVSDLGGTNRALMNNLQVDYEKPWFIFEGRKVYVFADVPHLIKLIRNHFIDTGFVIDGKLVQADIIAELLELTSGELSITHKVTMKHLTLSNSERQKVKMATKLFSNTVAQAITRAASLGYLGEKNWKECHELFKTTNDWFDVLNVRVPRADSRQRMHAYGLAIDIQDNILDKMSNMVQHMRVNSKNSLLPFQKGILQTNKALKLLFADLQSRLKFILTYRLNQDVLENFFGVIRTKGGLYDHPDRQEFKFRLRSYLLGRNDGILTTYGNTALDDTPDLELPSPSMTGRILSSINRSIEPTQSSDEPIEELPELELDSLENLAGYIGYRLKNSTDTSVLISDEVQSYLWVDHLSEGGLCKPSNEFLEIINKLEQIFRKMNGDSLLITNDFLKKHIQSSNTINCPNKVKELFYRTRMYLRIRKLNNSFKKNIHTYNKLNKIIS